MHTHLFKASVTAVGATLLVTVSTGYQESIAAPNPNTSVAPADTQPTVPIYKSKSGAASIAPPYSSEQQFDPINGTSIAMVNL